jgi:hypothetical protein
VYPSIYPPYLELVHFKSFMRDVHLKSVMRDVHFLGLAIGFDPV